MMHDAWWTMAHGWAHSGDWGSASRALVLVWPVRETVGACRIPGNGVLRTQTECWLSTDPPTVLTEHCQPARVVEVGGSGGGPALLCTRVVSQ